MILLADFGLKERFTSGPLFLRNKSTHTPQRACHRLKFDHSTDWLYTSHVSAYINAMQALTFTTGSTQVISAE